MKTLSIVPVVAGSLAVGTLPAAADSLNLFGTGRTLEIWDAPGSDRYPFAGLVGGVEVPMAFDLRYDDETAPTTLTDTMARFHFTGAGSTFTIDDRVVEATSLEVVVAHSFDGNTWVDFTMHSSVHEVRVNLGFGGVGLLPLEVPRAFDPFALPVEITANSYLNDLLVPNVLGSADTATITPAPGAAAVLIPVLLAGRRRRS